MDMQEIEGLNPETKTFSIGDLKKRWDYVVKERGMRCVTGDRLGSSLRAAEFEIMNEH